jgi:hypothetical protein
LEFDETHGRIIAELLTACRDLAPAERDEKVHELLDDLGQHFGVGPRPR